MRTCAHCHGTYVPTGQNQVVCAPCKPEYTREYHRAKHQRRYVRRGYPAPGPSHPHWKSGIGAYKHLGKKDACERCGSTHFLLVHHKDENRRNNVSDNLECLCKRCHQLHHLARDSAGRFQSKRSSP